LLAVALALGSRSRFSAFKQRFVNATLNAVIVHMGKTVLSLLLKTGQLTLYFDPRGVLNFRFPQEKLLSYYCMTRSARG
jgi:hypothetical protein